MPKTIELTIEINVQKVSCPGVWLCQDGRVSLTVFALGTSYQTCLLPPVFPLMYKDVFYFRKRFQETCALNNICCLLKDETIYCELVQWCEDCARGECIILAQYLGALNDVLFPPNMCSTDGVDLLMRRSREFPGILAPKIEIATKVRIDELWNDPSQLNSAKAKICHCKAVDVEGGRQKQVCHSAQYHRNKCISGRKPMRCRSRSRSGGSRSTCSVDRDNPPGTCRCPNPITKSRSSLYPNTRPGNRSCQYSIYNVETQSNAWNVNNPPNSVADSDNEEEIQRSSNVTDNINSAVSIDRIQKQLIESRYIEDSDDSNNNRPEKNRKYIVKVTPCVCEICKRYHELFHTQS